MRRILLMSITAAVLSVSTTAAQQESTIDQGKKVYAAQKCSLCHSIEGKGNKQGPLDGVGAKLSAEEIRKWLVETKEMTEKSKSTRKPPMQSYAKLPKDDIDALVEYLSSLKPKS